MDLLEFDTNPFGGVILRPDDLPPDPETFRRNLSHSLGVWTTDGYKVVWLELPLDHATHVPVAAEAGFAFHHATEDYVMMTHRLVDGAFIPQYATHYIGAGGVVVNDADELLVVQERGRQRAGPPFYKLPGGQLHHGEHLQDAVVREVLEETGVRTRFKAVVCFRNMHGYRYGKSDIYFVCRLEPLSYDITPQEEEIEECIWMPVDSYYESEAVSTFNKSIVRAALESPGFVSNRISDYNRAPDLYEFFLPHDQDDPWLSVRYSLDGKQQA